MIVCAAALAIAAGCTDAEVKIVVRERCDNADYGIARQDTGELMPRLLWRHWRADPYNEERLGIVSPTFLRRGDEHIEVQKWKKPCEGEQGFFSSGPRGEG
jgi:hypothetical protein